VFLIWCCSDAFWNDQNLSRSRLCIRCIHLSSCRYHLGHSCFFCQSTLNEWRSELGWILPRLLLVSKQMHISGNFVLDSVLCSNLEGTHELKLLTQLVKRYPWRTWRFGRNLSFQFRISSWSFSCDSRRWPNLWFVGFTRRWKFLDQLLKALDLLCHRSFWDALEWSFRCSLISWRRQFYRIPV